MAPAELPSQQASAMVSRYPKRVSASRTDTLLAVSDNIISTLKGVGAWTGLPLIQQAASVALTILAMLQNVRYNKDEFRRLAEDACEITYATALMCKEYQKKHQALSATTERDLKELVRKLKAIEQYAIENTQRKWYWKLATNKSDRDTITRYREDLKSSVALFGFQSQLTIREAVAKLEQQCARIERQGARVERQGARIEQQQRQIVQEWKNQGFWKSEEGWATTWLDDIEAPEVRHKHRGTIVPYGSPSASPLGINSSPWGFLKGDFVGSPNSLTSYTAIAGNKVETNNSTTIMHNNSGNTYNTTISESNNDNSVRHYGHHRPVSRR